jgi:GNAT superfamily N-acetyltransferase
MKIRPASIETDLQGLSRISAVCERYVSGTMEEEVRNWLEYGPVGRIFRVLVGVDESDSVTGYSAIVHEAWAPKGFFYIFVGVDPPQRRRGIGSALWKASFDFAREQNATLLTSEVWDDDTTGQDFAKQRGFAIERHKFSSSLGLTGFDEKPYLPNIAALEAQGIRFCTLAYFPDDPETTQKFYELNLAVVQDIPGENWDFSNYPEFFMKSVIGSPWFSRESRFLAIDGENWVGFAAVNYDPLTCRAYNSTTGVIRAYRARKIAQALKVLAICYAREKGALSIRTDNDSLNAPILAINHKMGYRAEPGKYKLVYPLNKRGVNVRNKEEIHEGD